MKLSQSNWSYLKNFPILAEDEEVVWKCPRGGHVALVEDGEVVDELFRQTDVVAASLDAPHAKFGI